MIFPVGPVTLYDEVGLDVAQKAGGILAAAFADRMRPSSVLDRMVADGRQGRKNGRGFFHYDEDGKKAGPDESAYAVIGNPAPRTPPERQREILRRMLTIRRTARSRA